MSIYALLCLSMYDFTTKRCSLVSYGGDRECVTYEQIPRKKDREREKERERDADRHVHRQTNRQTDIHT